MVAHLIARGASIGAICAGLVGGVTGLVIGLHVYAATAWFAVFEIGVPGALAGAVIGVLGAAALLASRRLRHRTHANERRTLGS